MRLSSLVATAVFALGIAGCDEDEGRGGAAEPVELEGAADAAAKRPAATEPTPDRVRQKVEHAGEEHHRRIDDATEGLEE